MIWKFNNEKPIYIQLVEQLYIKIVTNQYKPGEKIPSVRDLAKETQANPNTVQKALLEIEQKGLINTQRTNGKYVTDDLNLINEVKNEIINGKIQSFLLDLKDLNVSRYEIIELIKNGGLL